MPTRKLVMLLRMTASLMAMIAPTQPAEAQLTVIDPSNLIQNALNAARALEQVNNQVMQITNQIRQLENDARNLTRLGRTFAPDLLGQLDPGKTAEYRDGSRANGQQQQCAAGKAQRFLDAAGENGADGAARPVR